MDGVSLLLIQLSTLFLLIPIYIALVFLIYKIYSYEQLISNTKEFKNIKLLISRLNKPKTERNRDLSEITELAILVAKSAGEKLFNLFLSDFKAIPDDLKNQKGFDKGQQSYNNKGQQSYDNKGQNFNKNIEKMCSWVCSAVYDTYSGSEY